MTTTTDRPVDSSFACVAEFSVFLFFVLVKTVGFFSSRVLPYSNIQQQQQQLLIIAGIGNCELRDLLFVGTEVVFMKSPKTFWMTN